jgi:SAM-dependent methyltransferase
MAPIYVQYGCALSVGKDWLNYDNSPTLRVERMPVVGMLLGRIAGNSRPFPKLAKYGDICRGLPLADNTVRGVYASHVLEHPAFDDFRMALQNTFRILEPGGIFRLIVPDLHERARRYIQDVSNGSPEAKRDFHEVKSTRTRAKTKRCLWSYSTSI